MKCIDCVCYYKDERDIYPRCHFEELNIDTPPCEQEDIDRQREIDEIYEQEAREEIEREMLADMEG